MNPSPETAQPEIAPSAPVSAAELEERQKHNFDVPTAYELLDEVGEIEATEQVFFVDQIKTMSDLVTSGSDNDIEKAQAYYKMFQDNIEWAKDSDLFGDKQQEAIRDLLTASIGEEGVSILENNFTSAFKDGARMIKEAAAADDSENATAVYAEILDAIDTRTNGNQAEKDRLLAQFDNKINSILGADEQEWLDSVWADGEEEDIDQEIDPTMENDIIDAIDYLSDGGDFSEDEAERYAEAVVKIIDFKREGNEEEYEKLLTDMFIEIRLDYLEDDEGYEKHKARLIKVILDYRRGGYSGDVTPLNPDDIARVAADEAAGVEEIQAIADAAPTADEAESTDSENASFRARIGKRWFALKVALANPTNMENWANALGDKKGEKVMRNAFLAGAVGVAAVGLAIMASRKTGIDFMPTAVDGDGFGGGKLGDLDFMPTTVDGDGFDLNPFNNGNGDSVGSETVLGVTDAPVPEAPAPAVGGGIDVDGGGVSEQIVFSDQISSGDGVTHTIQDYMRTKHGSNLTPNQLGTIWTDMNSQNSPSAISKMFPGSSVGGEWGVTYNAPGQGGMTGRGSEVIEAIARKRGYIS